MRIFLAGASGVIGVRLVPLLVRKGHTVMGMTRSPDKLDRLSVLGAQGVVCNVYDFTELTRIVTVFRPDLVMHQLTDLPDEAECVPEYAARNSRIRTEGTGNLLRAAQEAGAERFLAQSIAWTPPKGGESIRDHERAVLEAGGVVVRYGRFYGPGTYSEADRLPPTPRIHVDEAARRTVPLLLAPPGVTVVAEDS